MTSKVDVKQYIRPVNLLPKSGNVIRQIHTARLKDRFFPSIPEWWMFAAFKIAKKHRSPTTVLVGQILWQQMAMKKSQPFRVSKIVWDEFGLERKTVGRALTVLESAGLVKVKRFKHRSPEIIVVTNGPESNGKRAG